MQPTWHQSATGLTLKVNLQKTFAMPAPAAQAWALLQDIERVSACMPGAKITERIDAQHYKGTVSVRFGPANMSFRGEVSVTALDEATRTLQLLGRGTDGGGGSGASMSLMARVDALDAGACNLLGSSELSISGKAAAFGARMADALAEQLLKQFAANFEAELKARMAAAPAQSAPPAAPGRGATSSGAQLNGLALLWAMILGWFRTLFSSRSA
jgi:carbon monoxide dehydrogenase subunit G